MAPLQSLMPISDAAATGICYQPWWSLHGGLVIKVSHLLFTLMSFVSKYTLRKDFKDSLSAYRSSVYEHRVVSLIGYVTKTIQIIIQGLLGRPLYTLGHAIVSLVVNLVSKMMGFVAKVKPRWKLICRSSYNSQLQGIVLDMIPSFTVEILAYDNAIMQKGSCITAFRINRLDHSHNRFHGSSGTLQECSNQILSSFRQDSFLESPDQVSFNGNSGTLPEYSNQTLSFNGQIPRQDSFLETPNQVSFNGSSGTLQECSNQRFNPGGQDSFQENPNQLSSKNRISDQKQKIIPMEAEKLRNSHGSYNNQRLNSDKQATSKHEQSILHGSSNNSILHGSSNNRNLPEQSILHGSSNNSILHESYNNRNLAEQSIPHGSSNNRTSLEQGILHRSSNKRTSTEQSILTGSSDNRSSTVLKSILHGSSYNRSSSKQKLPQHSTGASSPSPLLCILLLLTTMFTIASAQEFQILAKNVGISAMHAAVTRYGTVVLLDRTDIGPTKLKLAGGKCRNNTNDLALQYDCWAHSVLLTPGEDEASTTFRPLTVFTDTMCSSGQFLPDGTLLQLGGENDGVKKVRRFKPCRPTETECDWVEQPGNGLKSARWYSTSAILPDGRIIIVGGRIVFTYEFIPPTRNNGIDLTLDLLKRTKDINSDNLYPFVHLLPDDTIFIFANRDSIQLDYRENRIIKTFPTIPGEPRNYPSAGSSVLLPLLFADDFNDPEVMVCGGADVAAFRHPKRQMPCSDTCGRLKLWKDSPQWDMETMPIRRCMGDMVLLPTRQLLIINGAQNGSQGFSYASNPALNPVVYDFYRREFVTFPATKIPRMYHSTANLLPDGRVLVAGSNPQQFYEYVGDFPTELRVEAWRPPYLLESVKSKRPTIIYFPERIEYQRAFSVVFNVSETPEDVEINLISAPFTTHSYAQGQRLIHLQVKSRTLIGPGVYNVTVIGPPSPSVAPPSYYMMFPVQSAIAGSAVWVQLPKLLSN